MNKKLLRLKSFVEGLTVKDFTFQCKEYVEQVYTPQAKDKANSDKIQGGEKVLTTNGNYV